MSNNQSIGMPSRQPDDLVSVVVPVYNRAHLIARSIGSLLYQSYRSLEVIIVDDGSCDDIEGAVVALGDDRVRLVRHERNSGAAAARNTGLRVARGDLIAFHDSDDICVFDKIEQQVRRLESLPPDYVGVYCCRLFYSDVDEADYGRMKTQVRPHPAATHLSGNLADPTVRDNVINLPTLLVRTEAARDSGGFDERLRNNEDWDFSLRLSRIGRIGFVAEPLYLTPSWPVRQSSSDRISRNLHHTVRSYVRIVGKLRRTAAADRAAIARHETDTAGFLLREGRVRAARLYVRAAIADGGIDLRRAGLYAFSAFPEFYNAVRLYRRRRRRSGGWFPKEGNGS